MTYVRDARSAMPAVMKAIKVFERLGYGPKHQSNYDKFAQKETPFSRALNLMVHVTQVPQFRMKELEQHFWDEWYDDKIEQAPLLRKPK